MKKLKYVIICLLIAIPWIVGLIIIPQNSSYLEKDRSEKAALSINQQFVDRFFTYNSSNERYEGIQSFMTERGYSALFPSGVEMPQNSEVKSIGTNLKSYIQKDPVPKEGKIEILNDFDVSTEYGGIKSVTNMMLRTYLIQDETSWKVDDVELIIQNLEK